MASKNVPAISKLILERVRVFRARAEIELGALTVLAGANSSGKSTAMMGALLLKQTLDAPFDPGPLLLRDGHVELTSFEQLRTKGETEPVVIGLETTDGMRLEAHFDRSPEGDVDVVENTASGTRGRTARIRKGGQTRGRPVARERFFLGGNMPRAEQIALPESAARASDALVHILHVPGLRTPPQRDYILTAAGDTFDGRFDRYVASILLEWQRAKDPRVGEVGADLRRIGLTWKVEARRVSDTSVVLRVARLRRPTQGGARDLVEIADVGVGVSQALPVLVALRRARTGQLVYLEQPELHLHPRAQHALGAVLVDAAARGVRVVIETHSSVLLLGIQAAALEHDALEPAEVRVHWFERNDDGTSSVTSSTLSQKGALDGSPIDFDDVELGAHRAYLDAVERGPHGTGRSTTSTRRPSVCVGWAR